MIQVLFVICKQKFVVLKVSERKYDFISYLVNISFLFCILTVQNNYKGTSVTHRDLSRHTQNSFCLNHTTVTEGQLLAVGTTVSKEVCFSVFLYRKGITDIFNIENHDKNSAAKADVELSAPSQVSSVTWGRLKPSSWISSCYLKRLSGAAERQHVPPSLVTLQPTCLPRHTPGVSQPRSCAPKHPLPFSFQPPSQSFLQPPHP